MKNFHYKSLPVDVHFGIGKFKEVKKILSQNGYRKVLIITTPGQELLGKKAVSVLEELSAGVYPHAVMHVPVEVANAAVEHVQSIEKDLNVLPKVVIYDPELSVSLPAEVSACSGMNAMAHVVEALYAQDKNPIISLMAIESIQALKAALPIIVNDPQDIDARQKATYGAWLAGICLGSVGMAIHHKICHSLGGTFNLPHAQAHAITLTYSVHYNRHADVEAMDLLAMAFGIKSREDLGKVIYDLNTQLNIPLALKDIGLPKNGPAEVARIICDSPYYNPRSYDYAELEALLEKAYQGVSPA